MRARISLIASLAVIAAVPTSVDASPVVGLYRCRASQRCVYGPINESFPTYGNTYPGIGDCTFAAAADWEQVELGIEPDSSYIIYDFAQAGGTSSGLSQRQLWSYWEEAGGIEGYVLTGRTRLTVDRGDVENAVLDYGALLAQLRFGAGWGIGSYRAPRAGLHDLLVDGFTPGGPLVVTWGRTVQMTWEQWLEEAQAMWALSATAE